MQNQKVEMYYGSAQSYENEKRAGRINENALYFIDGILYCGYNLYTNKYEIVDTLPTIGVKNIIYKVRTNNSVAIWDSVDNMWIFIYEPNSGGGISETHTHDNKSVLDKITQTLFDTWNSAVSHISDTIKHITSTERKNWNDAYNKAHEHSNKTILDNITASYTTEEKGKLSNIESGAKANVQADWDITDTTSDAYIKNKPLVYTKNEVDNKFSALETNIDWKESVSTYDEIATTYPNPQDGWTVNVKDTDYTYRYDGTQWVAISANAIPKATNDVDGLLTKEDYAKISSIQNGAEVNQNAFSKVAVGSTTVSADSKIDTLTLVEGSNVNISADSDANKITISSTDTKYTHPTYTAKTSGLYKMTVDATGHVSATSPVTKDDITALGIPSSDTNLETSDVVDNLDSTDATKPLSANMGRSLNSNISILYSSISNNSTKISNHTSQISALNSSIIDNTNNLQSQINTLNSNMSEFVGFINADYLNTCNILKSLHGVYTEASGTQYVFSQLYCGVYTLQILYANDNTSINDKVAFRVIFTEDDTRETLKWTFLKTSSVV